MKLGPENDIHQSKAANMPAESSVEEVQEPGERETGLNANANGPSIVGTKVPVGLHAAQERLERRQQRRARVTLPVRLSPAHANEENFTNVLATLNPGRNGLYFTTTSQKFYERMRLRIVFPYNSAHDAIPASEDYGEVVRLDKLPDGRWGIAVQVRGSAALGQSFTRAKSGYQTAERRGTERYIFYADAAVWDMQSGTTVRARCSDLNVAGCFIDASNPFPEGTHVRLRLSSGEETFEIEARVVFGRASVGMGLAFCDPTPDQELAVVGWLNGLTSEALAAADELAIPPAANVEDFKPISRLIQLLRFRGVLTDADVTLLFSQDYLAPDQSRRE